MNPNNIAQIILATVIIYFFFIRPSLLRRHKFQCDRCGQCCRLRVKLTKQDISRLKKAGKTNFIENKIWLKRVNGY